MNSIDSTFVAVAIPQLTTALNAPLILVAWTIAAYQLTQVLMLPLAGKLSDSLGRRQVFLFCVGMFTLGSLLCGLAPSIGFLVAARALQAIGGGASCYRQLASSRITTASTALRRAGCFRASCPSAAFLDRTSAASSSSTGPMTLTIPDSARERHLQQLEVERAPWNTVKERTA
jgi:MFS family permease